MRLLTACHLDLTILSNPTYLWVKQYRSLTFCHHLITLCKKLSLRLTLLRQLVGSGWHVGAKTLFLFYFYFYLYIYPSDSQDSNGGTIHRVSNYPDLLAKTTKQGKVP